MLAFGYLIFSFLVILVLRNLFSSFLLAASQLATGSNGLGKVIYSILFFPGVVVHELSHFFAAALTGVHTARIEIFPREEDGQLKLGSVEMEKPDIFRSFFVGSAPLIVGFSTLYFLIKIRTPSLLQDFSLDLALNTVLSFEGWQDLLFVYALFSISNTMMLSKSDRQGLLPLVAIMLVSLILIAPLSQKEAFQYIATKLDNVFYTLSITLFLVAAGNFFFLLPLILAVKVLESLRKQRVQIKFHLFD